VKTSRNCRRAWVFEITNVVDNTSQKKKVFSLERVRVVLLWIGPNKKAYALLNLSAADERNYLLVL